MSDWKYYNNALIPNCAPNEAPNTNQLKEEFKKNKKALFARWITNWDCKRETNWWYVIKDDAFDINKLKSKRRYEINKGIKNFQTKVINPKEYIKELFDIQNKAWETYPEKYRPKMLYNIFEENIIKNQENSIYFGAFKDNKLKGFAVLDIKNNYVDFVQLKVIPNLEKEGINFAIIYGILNYYSNYFENNFYISDGSKAIFHETNFQEYLEKYFLFRKAYCILHMKYVWYVKPIIYLLYPFRNLMRNSENRMLYKIYAILKMEECNRNNNEKEKRNG